MGIADVNSQEVQKSFPGIRVHSSVGDLLDKRPDAVIIALPNQEHAKVGIECARRGISFLMEKPVTDKMEAAMELIAAVKLSGVKTLVGHHRRHHTQVRILRAQLASGELGNVLGVSAVWAARKPNSYFAAAPWRSASGGGPILINLVHEIDFLRFVLGEIVGVCGFASSRERGFPVEDTVGTVLSFESGAVGSFLLTDSAVSPWTTEQGIGESVEFPFSGEGNYRFLGTMGSIEFPNLKIWTNGKGEGSWNEAVWSRKLHAVSLDPYEAQLNHFHDVLVGQVPSLQPVEDGALTLLATLAVAESAAKGAWIDLRPLTDRLRA